jgi:mono/diheme cytochrome c family protein
MPRPFFTRRTASPGLAALGCGAGLVLGGLALPPATPALDAAAVARGGAAHAAHCLACHGLPGGPAPPLDARGHAWRHPDAELAGIIAQGIGGSGRQGLAMPGFAGQLGPDGIADLVAYLKSTWPAEFRRWQAALGPGGEPDLRALLADPSGTLPATCRPAPP